MMPRFEGRVSFAVGTGRCGTHLLQELLSQEPNVCAVHERGRANEAFHRYCKWYDLPVDSEGFLQTKECEIGADLAQFRYSHESSAHLSLSIHELFNRFSARFVLLTRRPDEVINSYIRKGWYEKPLVWSNSELAPGYQPGMSMDHFMGRLAPIGMQSDWWRKLGRVGKLAWFWNTLNCEVLKQFSTLPASNCKILRLEDFDYKEYRNLTRFLGFESELTLSRFRKIADSRPGRLPKVIRVPDWTEKDCLEFERLVVSMAAEFGYDSRVDSLKLDPREISVFSRGNQRLLDVALRIRERVGRSWRRKP